MKTPRLHFLNTPFDLISQQETLALIRSSRGSENLLYIVTPNVDHTLRCQSSAELASVYHNAWLSVCDSQIIARVARAKGYPIQHVVTGSDLSNALFSSVFMPDERLTVIGGEREVIECLRDRFKLTSLNHHNPPMNFINDEAAIDACCHFVAEHPADFILIAVGSPQQEYLASRLAQTPGVQGVALCIGASLLFLTGREKRAPRWMSRVGLEWLFRLSQNPKKLWRRYANNLRIFPLAWQAPRFEESALTIHFKEKE